MDETSSDDEQGWEPSSFAYFTGHQSERIHTFYAYGLKREVSVVSVLPPGQVYGSRRLRAFAGRLLADAVDKAGMMFVQR